MTIPWITEEVPQPDRESMLAATQFLLALRYDEGEQLDALRRLLGGRKTMIESPLYQQIVEEAKREARQQDILELLEDRFGPEARELGPLLNAVAFERLREFLKLATRCRSLASFRKRLLS